jgi:hypothetical protein
MPWTDPDWFGTVPWAERVDPSDRESPLLEIRPGELDAQTTAVRRIWYEFSNSTEWPRLMGVVAYMWQAQERGLGSVDQARYLSTAEGDVLDEIGALVNRPRYGLTDVQYRLAIRAEAGSIFSSGTIPEILELTRSLLGPDVRVLEYWPATIAIEAPDMEVEVYQVLLAVLDDVPAAGVGALLVTWDSEATGGYESTTGGTVGPPGAYSSTTGYEAPRGFYATAQPIDDGT